MADSKIVDLTEKTTLYYDDECVLNDVENTNVDKKIALSAVTNFITPISLYTIGGNITNSYYAICNKNSRSLVTTSDIVGADYYVHYTPFYVATPLAFNRIGVNVTLGLTGALTRLGIYAADAADGMPGTLIVDGGTVDCSSTGVKEATISVTLCGNYYFALCGNHGSVDYTGNDWTYCANQASTGPGHETNGAATRPYFYGRDLGRTVSTAFDSTALGLFDDNTGDIPRVHLRNV